MRMHGLMGRLLCGALLAMSLPALVSCGGVGDAPSSSTQSESEYADQEGDVPAAVGQQGASAADSATALIEAAEAKTLADEGAFVVDLRNRYAFADGHIAGARNTGSGKALQVQGDRLPHDRPILIVAADDAKGEEAWTILVEMGYEPSSAKVLAGGMEAWIDAGYPVATSEVKGC